MRCRDSRRSRIMANIRVHELVLWMMVLQLAGVAWLPMAASTAHKDGSENSASVIIIGAGIAGISAGKQLAAKGVKDILVLEGDSQIGGRVRTHAFGGLNIEKGDSWVEGVNGNQLNPIWKLVQDLGLRTGKSDYHNLSNNIYDVGGLLSPRKGAADFNLSDTTFAFDYNLGASMTSRKQKDISILTAQRLCGSVPETAVEMALDYYNYDYEFAEPPRVTSLMNTQPLPTFANFGPDLYFVSDPRGYGTVVNHLASQYLETENGQITDPRLKLNKVVREIQYSSKGVNVTTEDGEVYTAEYAIVTVSSGVLQSNLIEFKPDLPAWKLAAIYEFDMAVYTNIFLKFPYKFWPTGPGTEFFIYADERRGYYPIWQHLENEYPGSNVVLVTVTDDEARRIEQQSDKETLAEIMGVMRTMFGTKEVPEAEAIFVPRWWQARLFRGSFSNWPLGVDALTFRCLQAPVKRLYFGGEHTSEHYNGYVHGGYLSGIESADRVLQCKLHKKCESGL